MSDEPKHAGGRPTDYRPQYCQSVIAWGKLGKSKAWICAELDIVDNTMRNWSEAHPEFLQAMELSQKKAQQLWEDIGFDGMQSKSIDASIYSRSMAARFPNDWREKSENTSTINKGSGWDEIFAQVGNKTRSI